MSFIPLLPVKIYEEVKMLRKGFCSCGALFDKNAKRVLNGCGVT